MSNLNKFSPDYIGITNGSCYWGCWLGYFDSPHVASDYYFAFTVELYSYTDKLTFIYDNGNHFSDAALDTKFGYAKWFRDNSRYPFSGTDTYFSFTAGGLIPNTRYMMTGYAYLKSNSTWYTMPTVQNSWTPDITRPAAASSYPSFYPNVRSQYVYFNGAYQGDYGQAGTCTANALASACEVFEHAERAWHNTYFSNVWIYGGVSHAAHPNGLGMSIEDGITFLKTYGTPKWDAVPGCHDVWSDNRMYSNYDDYGSSYLGAGTGAQAIYAANSATIAPRALCQSINGSTTAINFYDSNTLATHITNYGCIPIAIGIPEEFDNVSNDGIVYNPTGTYNRGTHVVLLLGWETIGGIKHWIAQNGWDTSYGDSGLCYIPMDWGANSPNPNGELYGRWAISGCQIDNKALTTPTTPNAPTGAGRTDSGSTAGLNLIWNYTNYSDFYRFKYVNYAGTYYQDAIVEAQVNLTGLEYGVTYTCSVQGRNWSYDSAYGSTSNYTTAPKIPTCSEQSHDATSITVDFNVSAGNWSFVKIWYRISGAWSSITVNYPTTHGHITGLTAGQTYEIKVSSFFTVSGVDIESLGYSNIIYVTCSSPRPSNWTWVNGYDHVLSSDIVMDNANKRIKILTATQITNFQARINDFRVYKGYSNYSFTSATQYGSATASMANELRSAISTMSPPTSLPASVSSGNKITSAFIDGLVSSLNSIT